MAQIDEKALLAQAVTDNADSSTTEERDMDDGTTVSELSTGGQEIDTEDIVAPVENHEQYAIVGSWDEWLFAHEMSWEGQTCWCGISLGDKGEESFQILKAGKFETTLHPDIADAGPNVKHVLKGPDMEGHDLNWTIKGAPGKTYKIQLVFGDDGLPMRVTWDEVDMTAKLAEQERIEKELAKKGKNEWTAKERMEREVSEKAKNGTNGNVAKAVEETMQWYSKRFAKADETKILGKESFAFKFQIQADKDDKKPSEEALRMELEYDLGLKAGALAASSDPPSEKRRPVQECSQCMRLSRDAKFGLNKMWYCQSCWTGVLDQCRVRGLSEDVTKKQAMELDPTFGYAGSLDENPPYAKFDIRDEICVYVGGFRHGQIVCDQNGGRYVVVGVKLAEGLPRLWFQPVKLGRLGAGAYPNTSATALQKLLSPCACDDVILQQMQPGNTKTALNVSGEEVLLCRQCHLPLGEFAYQQDSAGEVVVHGECCAQLTLQNLQKDEHDRKQNEATLKKTRREEFDIGWKAERVPRNIHLATKLIGSQVQEGMCCLMLQEDSSSVSVAPTFDPVASVNLEYLSVALQVRTQEGREPQFSLDPVDPSNWNSKQIKRYEPDWLAGTSVGELMFQADYYLKELSMGEHEQPIVGMKSCFDLLEEEVHSKNWNAREWFIVRKAEMQLSDNCVLVPKVKMGVEAREQVMGFNGMEDVKQTRSDHPLVKYAESFTRNFDLIAERKSAIYHLRELAKASVMAKFLLDTSMNLENCWFELGNVTKTATCLEIPQLWNDRHYSQIHVQNGKIVDPETGRSVSRHGVYGGVDFGVNKFKSINVRPRAPVAAVRPAPAMSLRARVGWTLSDTAPQVVKPSIAMSALAQTVHGRAAPRGVDLNLNEFDLSTTSKVAAEAPTGMLGLETPVTIGATFWSNLSNDSTSVFKDEHKALLNTIFNPNLSDRRDEGDRFVPPETSISYVDELHKLVKEENKVRQQRKDAFFSSEFQMEDVGPLFPSSWKASFEIARGQVPMHGHAESQHSALLHARPDYKKEAHMFDRILKSTTPVFDKSTEDGLRFRIYKVGSLEVRTTQEQDDEEVIGVVFSIRTPNQAPSRSVRNQDKVVKVTEYVESATEGHHSYIVLETDKGDEIVTEQTFHGMLKWVENPADLEDRNSLAKVVRSSDCHKARRSIQDMKTYYQTRESQQSDPKLENDYIDNAYSCANGTTQQATSGFRHTVGECRWQLSKVGETRRQCANFR